MQAIVQRATGGPEVLRLEKVPDLLPGPGQVVVRLRAAALNRRDLYIRLGQYAGITLPITPGADGAGEILALGEGVTNISPGQEVVINPSLEWGDDPRIPGSSWRILGLPENGTYAQQVLVPASAVFSKPEALSWEDTAALPLAGLTAYRALVTRGQVQVGQTVLIPGIGGGVSSFILLFARRLGARVLVTSSSDHKLARARELGADAGFNYKTQNWVQEVRQATGGLGPDLVVDSVAGDTFNHILDVIRPGGRIVTYGSTLGAAPEVVVRRIFWKQLDVLGSTMGTPAEFQAMLDMFADGTLRPAVDQVFPLAEAGAAQSRMQESAQFGKIVLSIG
ncbi:MAG TPA: zinc-binding dehydrogenase [Chloroflexota bacterium]|jgi:NADPH:quinone reductase-like Zn-dependent oxidoreductase